MSNFNETIAALTISNTQGSRTYTPFTGTSTLTVNGTISMSNISTNAIAIVFSGIKMDLGGSQRTISVTNSQPGTITISSIIQNGGF
jgi:hypothetical protein